MNNQENKNQEAQEGVVKSVESDSETVTNKESNSNRGNVQCKCCEERKCCKKKKIKLIIAGLIVFAGIAFFAGHHDHQGRFGHMRGMMNDNGMNGFHQRYMGQGGTINQQGYYRQPNGNNGQNGMVAKQDSVTPAINTAQQNTPQNGQTQAPANDASQNSPQNGQAASNTPGQVGPQNGQTPSNPAPTNVPQNGQVTTK